ncbi:hypothetical protein [Pedobacter sp.]|uniref:hypothetical protein n=1 Tax=Pedobacter sp. TaxID=1411316 RepID=UPI0031E2FB60
MKTIIISLGVLMCSFFNVFAQKNKDLSFDNLYFFVQAGHIDDYRTFILGGAYLQMEHHYFRLSAGGGYDPKSEEQKQRHKSCSSECKCNVDVRGISTVNVEYGKIYKFFRRQQISFSSGFSIVTKTDPDVIFNQNKEPWEDEKFKKRTTVGLPYELRYSLMINRGIGIGCSYYGNMNARKSFNALSVGLALGLF